MNARCPGCCSIAVSIRTYIQLCAISSLPSMCTRQIGGVGVIEQVITKLGPCWYKFQRVHVHLSREVTLQPQVNPTTRILCSYSTHPRAENGVCRHGEMARHAYVVPVCHETTWEKNVIMHKEKKMLALNSSNHVPCPPRLAKRAFEASTTRAQFVRFIPPPVYECEKHKKSRNLAPAFFSEHKGLATYRSIVGRPVQGRIRSQVLRSLAA